MNCFKWTSVSWLFAVLLLSSLTVFGNGTDQQSENIDSVIKFLLEHVADSGLTFIRNSERHDAADAADHMNSKYQYFKDKIKNPEDFIQRCATKSLLSGKYYLVVLADGKEVHTSVWLNDSLANYRRSHAASSH